METKHRDMKKGGIPTVIREYWQNEPMRFALWAGIAFVAAIVVMSLILEYSYRPQTCLLCHEMKPAHDTWKNSFHGPLKGGRDDCLACHTSPGFGSKVKAKIGGLIFLWDHVLGNLEDDIKAELPVYCVRSGCHIDPWKMDRGSRIRVNHALHISKGYSCVVCHDRIAHGLDPNGLNFPGMKDFCFPCHNDEIASRSECQYCHIYQDAMALGKAGEGLPDGEPSSHQSMGLTCIECHTQGCVAQPVGTCLSCHSESSIMQQDAERAWVKISMKKLEEGLSRLTISLKKSEDMGQDISQINGIFNLVQGIYSFIKADASEGAHNPVYSRFLLENALNRLNYAFLVIDQKQRITL